MGRSPPVFKSFEAILDIGTERYRSAQNDTTQGSSEIELCLSVPLSDTRSGTIAAQLQQGGMEPQSPPIRSFNSSKKF